MLEVKKSKVSNIIMPIKYSRLSHNSLDKSDSTSKKIGEADWELAKKLCKAGSSHRKFMRQIHVIALVHAPWKWWKEYATYKIGTTENSSSMMHTLVDDYLDVDDFCFEKPTQARLNMIENVNAVLDKYYNAKSKAR